MPLTLLLDEVGDSLAGRYRYFLLHPFSLRELGRHPSRSDLQALLKFGGFPEPLFAQNEAEHRLCRIAGHYW